jgi:demethylmenaquinone methyltransferase/2-methoxy-6-polyprenyl-1,4-benzoquinol methylase
MVSRAAEKPAAERSGTQSIAVGSRPEGARDEREAGARVREMFGHIAPRYDFLNHFLSLSFDRLWRRRTARRFSAILERADARALDLCCGTGDLAFALSRRAAELGREPDSRALIAGSDFAIPMVELASAKGRAAGAPAQFLAGDALSLPFADGSFDLVTAGFGFRNLANYERGLREIARVLKPGGEVGLLEFSDPRDGIGAAAFRFYFRHILPRIGGAISGDSTAYSYLPNSVSKFPPPEELAIWMERAGFADVEFSLWNFGSVALHTGRKLAQDLH